jgi:TPR repeat protein
MFRTRNKSVAESLFRRADSQADAGNLRSAFRLMLAAARLGEISAQLNVGNYYVDGTGVRRNPSAGLYWYKKAYRRGYSSAAHNIGIYWKSAKDFRRALRWFEKAVAMGEEESNLDIGKYYLYQERDFRKAIQHFERVSPEGWNSEAGVEEAEQLLRVAKQRLKAALKTARSV